MDIYAKGQLSFLILNCLLDRDFYGLDIISEVKTRSNGRIELKKPSVYSNLTRMEKQGQVSSYMRASDVGPNRRYYSITEKGRNTYNSIKAEFERNHFDVFRDYYDEDTAPITLTPPPVHETTPAIEPAMAETQPEYQVDEELAAMQDDFFDFSALEEKTETKTAQTETVSERSIETTTSTQIEAKQETQHPIVKPVQEEIQAPIRTQHIEIQETVQEQVSPLRTEIKAEPPQAEMREAKNDAVFLTKTDMNDPSYNQRIYDITKDFNKYRKKRSFAEDQMAIEESAISFQEAEAKKQERLDNFKSSLLASKGKVGPQDDFAKFKASAPAPQVIAPTQVISEPQQEVANEQKNDAVFITEKITNTEPFKTKKIEPPRLKINATPAPLPAPNRDVNIDPSHKEIISQLYSKSKGSEAIVTEPENSALTEAIYDYDDLRDYYSTQNIQFKAYEQMSKVKHKHNTNKLYLISSLITLALLCVASGVIYAVLSHFKLTSSNTDFLYLILPALYLIEVVVDLCALRYTSWEPKPMWPQWLIWAIMTLCIGVTFGLNFIFGMNASAMLEFATSLILPCVLLAIVFPARYYIKRGIIIKHWK